MAKRETSPKQAHDARILRRGRVTHPDLPRQSARLERDRDRVLDLILRNEPLAEILAQLVSLVEHQQPDTLCAVLVAREDRLHVEAAPSLPDTLVAALNGLSAETIAGCDLASTARHRSAARGNAGTASFCDRCRPLLQEFGLRDCWSVPISYGSSHLLGAILLYHSAPTVPGGADLELFEMASKLASLAITHSRLFDQAARVEGLGALARLKSEFLSTASHELRMPLSLIYGYAELLLERAPSLSAVEVAAMASEICISARTMIRLVDDLLDLSRVERGKLQLHRRRLPVAEVLGHIVESFRHQPDGERISAELPAGVEANLDPERLTQIVSNLLSNALRYAPDGPIVLRATYRRDSLRIEVSDQGPGISTEEQSLVWEKFYRGGLAADSIDRGSGLGLAVVKQLVELQGGRVGLRSAPTEGTTFWATIPVADKESAPSTPAEGEILSV